MYRQIAMVSAVLLFAGIVEGRGGSSGGRGGSSSGGGSVSRGTSSGTRTITPGRPFTGTGNNNNNVANYGFGTGMFGMSGFGNGGFGGGRGGRNGGFGGGGFGLVGYGGMGVPLGFGAPFGDPDFIQGPPPPMLPPPVGMPGFGPGGVLLGGAGTIAFSVPENALVWVDKDMLAQTGAEREFTTPNRAPGTVGAYTVRVRWTEKGEEKSYTQRITVRPGARASVTIFAPPAK